MVCLSIGPHSLTTLSVAFMRGYVAGVHMVSKGSTAEEHVCEKHAANIDEAMTSYIGAGVDFPNEFPRTKKAPAA